MTGSASEREKAMAGGLKEDEVARSRWNMLIMILALKLEFNL